MARAKQRGKAQTGLKMGAKRQRAKKKNTKVAYQQVFVHLHRGCSNKLVGRLLPWEWEERKTQVKKNNNCTDTKKKLTK